MAIVGGRETSSNLFFFFFSFWMIITKRKEGTGHSNVRTVVRGVGKTQVCPFCHSPSGQRFSPQDCLSKKTQVHIKWIIYELPLDRGIYLYQEINICSGRFLMKRLFFSFKYYCKNKQYHRNINNNILSGSFCQSLH